MFLGIKSQFSFTQLPGRKRFRKFCRAYSQNVVPSRWLVIGAEPPSLIFVIGFVATVAIPWRAGVKHNRDRLFRMKEPRMTGASSTTGS
jgi:hypothetical protein